LPVEVVRVPFYGNFTTVRNLVLEQIKTRWALLVFGNEVLSGNHTQTLLDAVERDALTAYSVCVSFFDHEILARPVRLLPNRSEVRFVGRIWPTVSGSLVELGLKMEQLDVYVFREEDRSSTLRATNLVKEAVAQLARENPRHWRAILAQAVIAWAEHRYADARRRLEALPKNLSGEPRLIAEGLSLELRLEQGQLDEAWRHSQQLVQQYPFRVDFWALAGEVFLKLARPTLAVQAFRRALQLKEVAVPHLPPGYATYAARLKIARAEIEVGQTASGLLHLLALIDEFPGYRAAWQEVLSHLSGMSPADIFAALRQVVSPSKIRHFFTTVPHPTEDESRVLEWIRATQLS
jgi:tetratricopeptide (TPR) repeat protein